MTKYRSVSTEHRHVNVRDLQPGELIAWKSDTIGPYTVEVPMRVVDVRLVPEADRTDDERKVSRPPHYLQLEDPKTGKRNHYRVPGNYYRGFDVLAEHHPVCSSCGGLWPCREHLIGLHVRAEADRLNQSCIVCGKRDGWRIEEVRTETPDGEVVTRYHTRKGSACRTAYLKAIAGDEKALARLQKEDNEYAVMLAKTRGVRRGRR